MHSVRQIVRSDQSHLSVVRVDGVQISDCWIGIDGVVLNKIRQNRPIHTRTAAHDVAGHDRPTGVRVIRRHDQTVLRSADNEIHMHRAIWIRRCDAGPAQGIGRHPGRIKAAGDDPCVQSVIAGRTRSTESTKREIDPACRGILQMNVPIRVLVAFKVAYHAGSGRTLVSTESSTGEAQVGIEIIASQLQEGRVIYGFIENRRRHVS